jgi:hypothetical protein
MLFSSKKYVSTCHPLTFTERMGGREAIGISHSPLTDPYSKAAP